MVPYRCKITLTLVSSLLYHQNPITAFVTDVIQSSHRLTSWGITEDSLFKSPPFSSRIPTSSLLYSQQNNDNNEQSPASEGEGETLDQLEERMKLVRQLQKSFYQNETPIEPPKPGSTIISNLPLWRVQWTELPGYQNVLNVHVPNYTNMFLKIINSSSTTKNNSDNLDRGNIPDEFLDGSSIDSVDDDNQNLYFGHLYLPKGSENLDNPDYRLLDKDQQEDSTIASKTKATHTGVLMKISDHKQLPDGRLALIVQALERFRVIEVERSHSPYAIATVEILPDEELIDTLYDEDDDESEDDGDLTTVMLGEAVEEAFRWHPYEFKKVTFQNSSDDNQGTISVSPLVNFDGEVNTASTSSPVRKDDNNDDDTISPFAQTTIDRVMELEYSVWVQLDIMIKLLQKLIGASNMIPATKVPVPTQILGLLPIHPPKPWPADFALWEYARQMESGDSMVGTDSKSPFVRADACGNKMDEDGSENEKDSGNVDSTTYPPLRRAQRLSYVIWILCDSLVLNESLDIEDKQDLLEITSVAERLKRAEVKLKGICDIIRVVLNEI